MVATRPLFTLLLTSLLAALLVACGQNQITGGEGGGGSGGDGDSDDPGGAAQCVCTDCERQTIGINGQPFDIVADPNEFVGTDGEGALVVNKANSLYTKYLWVADTQLPGVLKIDLTSFQIVGHYRTGGGSTSRTTVNSRGEAFVGSRMDGNGPTGVTKVLPYGTDCPDTNGDGVITTSSGRDDILPYGQDDCVAWHTPTQGDIRGLASQDIAGSRPGDACTSEDDTTVEVPEQHFIWAGGLHGKIYKLDADTGAILMTLDAPLGVYGMALGGDGKLWIGTQLSFLDTTKCTDEATCNAAPVCDVTCNATSCPDTCDDAVKTRVTGVYGYGITVDCEDRIWMSGGWSQSTMTQVTYRYDPHAPADARLAEGPPSGGGGIAADANGWVWGCTSSTTITRIDAETLEGISIDAPSKGVAVDSTGRVLTVYWDAVHLIEPGLTLDAYDLTNNVTPLPGFTYAYSDMTGVQTRLASDDPGWYRHTFDGCADDAETDWRSLAWDIDAPPGTHAAFFVRSADTLDELASAPWQAVANCIDSEGCMDGAAITGQTGKYLEIEVRLTATDEAPTDGQRGCGYVEGESVRVRNITVTSGCSGRIG